jgi:site-specific recombinase XerD
VPNRDIDEFLQDILKVKCGTELNSLREGYKLCAQSEGKSSATITIVDASVRYLEEFLSTNGLSADIARIRVQELRHFIVHLQRQQPFTRHRFTKPQQGQLSGHTVNGYLRALRAFWAWAQREGFVQENPFLQVQIPKAPKKVMPTFTQEQLRRLIAAIDTRTPLGYRDYIIILTLMDTGIRCSELTGLKVQDVNLQARLFKVWGKGAKERMVPFGRKVQSALWKYLTYYRPEPLIPCYDHVFLTGQGRPLTKDRVEAIVEHYGTKAGISGVRVSPHTFRHNFAVMFLRNGGDVFSLQRIMGHSTLDVLRIYVNMAQADIQEAHRRHSPADNMDFKPTYRRGMWNNGTIEKETIR